jgi:dUTP pyrophosphatase
MKNLKVLKLSTNAKIPTKSHSIDAGFDLYSAEDKFIPLNTTTVISTDLAVDLDEGYVLKIEDRSSLAAQGTRTGGGIVDSGYLNSVKVILHNLTSIRDSSNGVPGIQIKKGDRIAQFLITKIENPEIVEVTSFETRSDRNLGGLGSTGR